MRISDWSSDVCSSDLTEVTNLPNLMGYLRFGRSLPVVRFEDSYNKVASIGEAFEERGNAPIRMAVPTPPEPPTPTAPTAPAKPKTTPAKRRRAVPGDPEIGRASCRERVCQYV